MGRRRQENQREDAVTALRILSGGAAQGLVAALAERFKALTGLDIDGEFGAVGTMAGKLEAGTGADLVVLTAAVMADLVGKDLVIRDTVVDIGIVETAIARRAGDPPVSIHDAASLREALLAADAIFVPDTKASTAGIHVASVLDRLGIAAETAPRLRTFPNGATAMRHLAASDALTAIGCTQSTEIIHTPGVVVAAALPPGYGLATVYAAAVTSQSRQPADARQLIALLTAADLAGLRERAGFLQLGIE
jgi:molybdate transport system substrate-binding protein